MNRIKLSIFITLAAMSFVQCAKAIVITMRTVQMPDGKLITLWGDLHADVSPEGALIKQEQHAFIQCARMCKADVAAEDSALYEGDSEKIKFFVGLSQQNNFIKKNSKMSIRGHTDGLVKNYQHSAMFDLVTQCREKGLKAETIECRHGVYLSQNNSELSCNEAWSDLWTYAQKIKNFKTPNKQLESYYNTSAKLLEEDKQGNPKYICLRLWFEDKKNIGQLKDEFSQRLKDPLLALHAKEALQQLEYLEDTLIEALIMRHIETSKNKHIFVFVGNAHAYEVVKELYKLGGDLVLRKSCFISHAINPKNPRIDEIYLDTLIDKKDYFKQLNKILARQQPIAQQQAHPVAQAAAAAAPIVIGAPSLLGKRKADQSTIKDEKQEKAVKSDKDESAAIVAKKDQQQEAFDPMSFFDEAYWQNTEQAAEAQPERKEQ